jgi:hypothetical protein
MATLLKVVLKLKKPNHQLSQLLRTMPRNIFNKFQEGIRNNGSGGLNLEIGLNHGHLISPIIDMNFWNIRRRR